MCGTTVLAMGVCMCVRVGRNVSLRPARQRLQHNRMFPGCNRAQVGGIRCRPSYRIGASRCLGGMVCRLGTSYLHLS